MSTDMSKRRHGLRQMLAPPAHRHRFPDYATRHAVAEEAPQPGLRAAMGFRILDNATDGLNSAYAHRVGSLFRFADRLVAEGVLDGKLEDMDVQHRLQQCAYIAQQMGACIDYEFGFMCSGAFSVDIAVDVYQRDVANGVTYPFAHMADKVDGFLDLVREHTTEWLQLASFAMRPAAKPHSREEFVERVAWRGSGYDQKRAAQVYDAVAALRAQCAGRGA